jgi:hypothetical protein
MKVKPKKCKHCAKLFTPQRSSLEVACSVNCAIELNKPKLLVKGTKEFKAAKTEVKIGENRSELQKNINLLSRMIDASFGFNTCIDCGKIYGKQVDAAHFHNVKGNEQLRFNLHNLHSAKSDCNKYSSEHKVGYIKGLEQRYGIDYLNQVKALKTEVKELKLNAIEIAEKLKLVRHIIRNFDKYKFDNALIARNQFNKIIGIYDKDNK